MSIDTVTLIAGGDIGPEAEPVDHLPALILPVLKDADLRFGQCERTYGEQGSVSQSDYAHGSAHPRLASIWKAAGIDIVSMASNHAMDRGTKGLLGTIELFRNWGMYVIGAGKNFDEAHKPAIVVRNGVRIAFLAYCSVLPEGHEAAEQSKPGIAPMRAHTYYMRAGDPHEESNPGTPPTIHTVPHQEDLQVLQEDIRKAKQQADVVVMSIHWGLHHVPKAIATYQPVVAHAAIDAGADLILGHHPHCLKAIEVYKGKVCFYSLGNFMITHGPNSKQLIPANWGRWNLWWYRLDPEYMPPKGIYFYPPDSRKTLLVKAVLSKNGVDKVSFLPAFINPQAQPAVVSPDSPKFQEIFEYVEWISDQFPHKFQVQGNEVVVDVSS